MRHPLRAALSRLAPLLAVAFAAGAEGQTTPPELLNPEEVAGAIEDLYPPALRAAGAGGVVRVRLLVAPGGRPEALEVVESSDPRLSAPALRALERARFRPATRAGEPVPYRLVVPVRFEAPPPDGGHEIGVRAFLNPDEVAAAVRREYPAALLAAGVSGGALVKLTVGEDGTVRSAEALSWSHPEFGPAAERALRTARFRRADGTVVLRLPVRFDPPERP